jgi:RNA polymerase sigma-70 factor (ECF subfamily)
MTQPLPSSSAGEPTLEILLAVRAGDRARFGELYERVAPALYAWVALRIRATLRGRLEPDEVLQEVWCKALEQCASFDPVRVSFRAWIFTVARHVLLQAIEAQARVDRARSLDGDSSRSTNAALVPDEVTSVSQRLSRDEGLRRFLADAERMEHDDRLLLLLCGLEGKSLVEAAPVMGVSRDAAAKRWQRLRAKLQVERYPLQFLLPDV